MFGDYFETTKLARTLRSGARGALSVLVLVPFTWVLCYCIYQFGTLYTDTLWLAGSGGASVLPIDVEDVWATLRIAAPIALLVVGVGMWFPHTQDDSARRISLGRKLRLFLVAVVGTQVVTLAVVAWVADHLIALALHGQAHPPLATLMAYACVASLSFTATLGVLEYVCPYLVDTATAGYAHDSRDDLYALLIDVVAHLTRTGVGSGYMFILLMLGSRVLGDAMPVYLSALLSLFLGLLLFTYGLIVRLAER